MYFYFGKNASSFSHTSLFEPVCEFVSQQMELCVFRCVASAAHFFILGGKTDAILMKIMLFTSIFTLFSPLFLGLSPLRGDDKREMGGV